MSTEAHFSFPYVYHREVIALGAALPAVCILVVALRFYARKLQHVGCKADDWLSLCALLPTIGLGVCLITGARLKNMGYPTPDPPSNLSSEELETYVDPTTRENEIIQFPFQILLMLSYGFIKLSIIFFYRRIFVVSRGTFNDILLIVMAVVVVLWTFAFEMLIIFACGTHFWANWGSAVSQGQYCSTVGFTSEYGLAISDLILDIIVFVIPIPLIWRLQMKTQRKLAVIGVFLLGASAIGASICRLIVYVQVVSVSAAAGVLDTNLALTLGYYWSMLEAGLALIACCLPPLASLITHIRESSPSRHGISMNSLRRIMHTSRSQTSVKSSYAGDYERSESLKDPDAPPLRIERAIVTDIEHSDMEHGQKGNFQARPSEC